MATRVVVFDGIRINNADTTAGWEDFDGSKWSGSTEPDFYYQGTASQSVKVGTTRGGPGYDSAGTVNYSSPTRVLLAKVIATNYAALKNTTDTDPGGQIRFSSGGLASNNADYYVVGGDTYPAKGGWLIIPVDPNVTPSTGSATVTAIDGYAWHCNFNASSRANNVAMDAIDYIPLGKGMTITRGDGTGVGNEDATFQDFIDYDQGETATDGGRYGVVSTQDGIIYTTGTLTIGGTGTAGVTEFTDSGQIIVFPEAEFIGTAGFFGIDIDLSNASTSVSISDSVFKSDGTEAGNSDTRPTYNITGTSGSATYEGCTFDTFNTVIGTSGLTLDSCIFLNGEQIQNVGATVTNCSFSNDTNAVNNGYLETANLNDITNCTFTYNSAAHGIEITSAGTYTFSGNTLLGYAVGSTGTFDNSGGGAPSGPTDAAIYNSSGGTVNIGVTGGSTVPSIRNSAGSTTVVTADATITITVQDGNTDPIENAQVAVYKVSDDSEVFNTLTNASGIASGSTDQNIDLYIRVRKSPDGATRFFPVETVGNSGSNLALTVTLTEDTIAQ